MHNRYFRHAGLALALIAPGMALAQTPPATPAGAQQPDPEPSARANSIPTPMTSVDIPASTPTPQLPSAEEAADIAASTEAGSTATVPPPPETAPTAAPVTPAMPAEAAAITLPVEAPATTPIESTPRYTAHVIQSQILNENRVVNVYLPPDYATASERRYPVLYLTDGGVRENFPHIATTIDAMIRAGNMLPLIIVGIENSQRDRDMTPAAADTDGGAAALTGAAAFRHFLRDEVFPDIDQRYRTNIQRAIAGEARGGLFVIDTLLHDPTLFQRYIAIDAELGWNNASVVTSSGEGLAHFPDQSTILWFATSNARSTVQHSAALAGILRQFAPPQLIWDYEARPALNQDSLFRDVKEEAFRWALWPVSEDGDGATVTVGETPPAQ